ncbi:MAG: hypothetical protein VX705_05960, partial [Verrucomicrobiota bacterium]|nr:hypothetical protein [Verrucomicrobiota bacterium]
MHTFNRNYLFSYILVAAFYCQGDTKKWDAAWRQKVDVQLVEIAGLARVREPVEVRLPAKGLALERWQREARVVELSSGREMPSQVLAAGKTDVSVVFQVTLDSKQQRVFRVYFDNAKA